MNLRAIVFAFALLFTLGAQAQVVDEIIGAVGDKIILKSEIEAEVEQIKKQAEGPLPPDIRCEILNQKLAEKLMLHKADLDSVVVDEDRVNTELESRVRRLIAQFGGEKAFEDYYGKTIAEIKAENRDKIRESMVVEEMRQKVLKDVKVSPTDVKKYFNSIPEDSLPFYSAEIEVAQIIRMPKVSKQAKEIALMRITEIRERIMQGESFQTLAVLYSDDPGSAAKGGELGFFNRGDMVPEFDAQAFRLKKDTVSKIIETNYGYHILQLIARRGESANVRHILIRAQTTKDDLKQAKELMDSLYYRMKYDSLPFVNAAKKYSDEEETKSGGGFLRDPQTGSTKINVEMLDKSMYLTVEKMKPGEISEPELIRLPDGSQAYRMIYLKSEIPPHKANLREDYQKFQGIASAQKQQEVMYNWIGKYKGKYYVKVGEDFHSCTSLQMWLKK